MDKRNVDFIVIGAMRCGTTSLYFDLAKHPEISMSRKKETNFFLSDCDPLDYAKQFNASKPIWGEASPNYSKWDIFPNVPKRIFDHSPNVKLIYLVRDPCDRVLSQYRHAVALERIEPDEVINIKSQQLQHMIETSKYAKQLSHFETVFPIDAICVVKMEELENSRQRTLDRITKFIGASAHEWSSTTPRENTSLALGNYPKALTRMRENTLLNGIFDRLPMNWRSRAKTLVSHKSYCIKDEHMSEICRDELLDELRADMLKFADKYQIDIQDWLRGACDI